MTTENYSLNIAPELFRYFIRKFYNGVDMSNEEIDEIRNDFVKYLENMNFNQLQRENCLPKNEADIIMNMDNPLRMFGFPPAFVLHFTKYVEEQAKKITELDEKTE